MTKVLQVEANFKGLFGFQVVQQKSPMEQCSDNSVEVGDSMLNPRYGMNSFKVLTAPAFSTGFNSVLPEQSARCEATQCDTGRESKAHLGVKKWAVP